jgi:predicted amidohydrolase YtcJ
MKNHLPLRFKEHSDNHLRNSMNTLQSLAGLLAVAVMLVACGRTDTQPASTGADLVFLNGRIYTVDDKRTWAQAVAITAGRISFVGSDDRANDFIGSNTTVVDLRGRMMLPAFQDAHIHPITSGMDAAACNLSEMPGLPEYRSTIAAYAAANPDEPWILGGGWSMAVFGPGAMPSRSILDELVSDRPVYLSSADGHTGWANSAALKIAGIDKDTPDPADGRIDRDPATGEPIGSLQEGAMSLVTRHIPATTPANREAGLRYTMKMLNAYGITSVQDAIVNREELETYTSLDSRGELNLRVVAALWWDRDRDEEQIATLLAMRESFTNGRVRPATVKIMLDGVMENYTAAMLEPYLVPDRTRGIPMIDPESLKQIVSALDAEDFQVHFHAIGDAAIRQSLDAVEAARNENGARGNRHHVSHLQIIDPTDIPRFKELDVVANFQPLWAYADKYITELTIPFIGEERTRWMYPIRSVEDAGGMIAFGSDWSVSSANPFYQIETAITRQDATGELEEVFIPEERISLESAIAAFTINAAFVNQQEQDTGSIEVGKYADLIVLNQDLFNVTPAEISDTRSLLTLLEGTAVHGDIGDL